MKVTPLSLDGIVLFEGPVFSDTRGVFMETWRDDHGIDAGVAVAWQQENLSVSKLKGTIRGLHWQLAPFAQAKLVRVVVGRIFDVVVDIRKSSTTFGQALGVELSGDKNQALLVPVGFAHGFCTLEAETVVTYKTGARYNPGSERSLHWASANLAINWPQDAAVVISEKDAAAPHFNDIGHEDFF